MDTSIQEEEWHGRFFASDEELAQADYEPDHVLTVSELTGKLPALTKEEKQLLAEREAEDYRMILMDSKLFRKPKREKGITRSAKILIAVMALLVAVLGTVGMAFFFSSYRRVPIFSVTVVPAVISSFVFLFSTMVFFLTKGWTEKLAGVVFALSGVFLMLLLSGVVVF